MKLRVIVSFVHHSARQFYGIAVVTGTQAPAVKSFLHTRENSTFIARGLQLPYVPNRNQILLCFKIFRNFGIIGHCGK